MSRPTLVQQLILVPVHLEECCVCKLGFLKRNLKRCTAGLKRLAYVSIVRLGQDWNIRQQSIWEPYLAK